MTAITAPPEAIAAIDDAKSVAAVTRGYKVRNADEHAHAGELLQRIKGAAKRLIDRRKALTDPIDESRRAAMALFAPQVADLETAERDVKRAIGVYLDVQEQERRRLQADAEAKARKERERLQAQAQAAEKAGKVERSEVLAERAAQVVAPVVVTAPPRVAGQSVRKAWKFEIVDAQAIPREYLVPDESKIRKVVAALGADAVIAGVRVYAETVIASRSI